MERDRSGIASLRKGRGRQNEIGAASFASHSSKGGGNNEEISTRERNDWERYRSQRELLRRDRGPGDQGNSRFRSHRLESGRSVSKPESRTRSLIFYIVNQDILTTTFPPPKVTHRTAVSRWKSYRSWSRFEINRIASKVIQ